MKETLTYLFEKYLNDELSAKEWTRLRSMIEASDPEQLDDAMKALYDQRPLPYSNMEADKEQVFRAIGRRLDDATDQERRTGGAKGRPGLLRRMLPRYAVAAAVAGLLGTGAWFFFHRNGGMPAGGKEVAGTVKPILPPADAKAWLTLADGRRVALEAGSTAQATGEEGNHFPGDSGQDWKMFRRANGLIDYHVAGNKKDSRSVAFNTLSTSRGIQYQVILPDGSHVWLNSASSIRYPVSFAANERKVELDGEGYFEIAPNAKAPFRVKLKNMQVEVLGTGFNIMAYGDEPVVRTTLFQGGVRVAGGSGSVVLKPGEQACLSDNGGSLSVQEANLDEVSAWREGKFLFKKRTIEEIMRQVSRWYDVEVEYRGKRPEARLSGELSRKEQASQLLEILQATDNVHFSMEGNKIIVTQ